MHISSFRFIRHTRIPAVSVERSDIPVPLSPIWPVLCSTGVLESDVTSCSLLEIETDMRLIIYLDDILMLEEDPARLNSELGLLQELFQALGLVINKEKSHLRPTQEITLLRFQISVKSMSISLQVEKLRKIAQDTRKPLRRNTVSVRELTAFVGKTRATRQAILVATSFHRHLQALINRVIPHLSMKETCEGYNQMVELSQGARKELTWWSQEAVTWNSAPIIPPAPGLIIETNASLARWGACCGGVQSCGLWSREEQEMHINVLELLAVTLAVKSFTKNRKNIETLITTDNRTAMAYINHLGGTHSSVLNELVSGLWRWTMERNIFSEGRASPQGKEHNSRQGIKNGEGSMQLDDPPKSVCTSPTGNGSIGGGHVCLTTDTSITTFFQLETGPASRGNGYICTELEGVSGMHKPSSVPVVDNYVKN